MTIKLYKYYRIFLMLLLTTIIMSCNEGDDSPTAVTYFPTFEYEPILAVDLGSSYVQNVTATEDGVELPIEVSGVDAVNTDQVGVYNVTFSAVNSDGYPGTVTQVVVVHDPNIVGTDVSGEIWDKNNHGRTGTISLVPGTTSIFYCTDFGFGGAFPMYFQMDGDTISEIYQDYNFAAVNGVDLGYNPVAMEFTTLIHPYGYSYTFEYQQP